MGKKQKSIATGLDEIDRSLYSTFCNAASSLSQHYTQAINHQNISFHSGQRHAYEKLYQWILRQQEGGARVSTSDILTYLQSELNNCGDEPPMSSRVQVQHSHSQSQPHFTNSGGGFLVTDQTPTSQTTRIEHENQSSPMLY